MNTVNQIPIDDKVVKCVVCDNDDQSHELEFVNHEERPGYYCPDCVETTDYCSVCGGEFFISEMRSSKITNNLDQYCDDDTAILEKLEEVFVE